MSSTLLLVGFTKKKLWYCYGFLGQYSSFFCCNQLKRLFSKDAFN